MAQDLDCSEPSNTSKDKIDIPEARRDDVELLGPCKNYKSAATARRRGAGSETKILRGIR